jgi:SAM-dependent methyltransferase
MEKLRTMEELLIMLDGFFVGDRDRWTTGEGSMWWDSFYRDRDRPIPFFRASADESLHDWHIRELLSISSGARALDLGCGPGRNALWFARQGYRVDAVDLSTEAITWAREHASGDPSEVVDRLRFAVHDVFTWPIPVGAYDVVHDSGCFHHLPPHRRISYLELLDRAVAPGGHFTLTCFAAGRMGSEAPDDSFYKTGSLEGGLGYAESELVQIFSDFTPLEIRAMHEFPRDADRFGQSFLCVALFRRPKR